MPYQVNVFQNWVSLYNSWDELKVWLTSEAGGLLNVTEPSNSKYALVRYVKNVSKMDVPHVRWCRSVIVEKNTRIPVSVAPPKSSELTDTSVGDAVVAEEFVEGTMMSIFHASSDEAANVATRGRIGADKSFCENSPTFRSMLDDVMKVQNISCFNDVLPTQGLNRFTSVVVQHPQNRIVKNVTTPSMYIIHQGWVTSDGTCFIEENPSEFNNLLFIPRYSIESVRGAKSLKEWISSQSLTRDFGWQGLVLKDGSGTRWRERSESYETVRRLRGNEATSKECYTRLRKTKSLEQYLALYPADKAMFYTLEGVLRKNTRSLYRFYVDTFSTRKVLFYELPWPYKHHVSVLHNYYKNILRAQKKRVEMDTVIHYVNSLNIMDMVNMLKEHKMDLVKKTPQVVVGGAVAADASSASVNDTLHVAPVAHVCECTCYECSNYASSCYGENSAIAPRSPIPDVPTDA